MCEKAGCVQRDRVDSQWIVNANVNIVGGGMGGIGGSVNYIGFDIPGSGGGGGFGNDATGGEATSVGGSGGLGSFVNLSSGTSTTSGGPGGNGESSNGGTGGLYAGGFGGGGGASGSFDGGNGSGGFGAGAGAQLNPNLVGGGGLGAGGAVFTMGGASLTIIKPLLGTSSFAGNTVAAGLAGHEDGIVGNDGSAYGVDFFLGADTTFDVNGGESLSLASLGGAGNLSDANVAGNASDPNAQGGVIKTGAGTLVLTGSSYYSGVTTIHSGTLALGQSDGVNNLAGFTLAGGVLQTGTSLSETFGALAVIGSTSLIDFLGNAATLNFATLDLGGQLSIWNYSGATDFFEIATGTATGSLDQISFYSDEGTTFLGYGGFESTRIVPVAVPEPSTIAMALAGLAAGGILRRRRKGAASPRVSSPL